MSRVIRPQLWSRFRRRFWWLKEARQEQERLKFLGRSVTRKWKARSTAPNVLLLSIDSLSAKHLGCYGYDRPTSPNLDRLAQSGVLFQNVMAQVNWTKPALASLLTSLYPSVHRTDSVDESGDRVDGGVNRRVNILDTRFRTLAREFKDNGYRTVGASNGGYAHSLFGFSRGFDFYDDHGGGLKSCFYRMMQWLWREPGTPFFGFIHCWDSHFPYMDRPPYNHLFVSRRADILLDSVTRNRVNRRQRSLSSCELDFLKGLFDGSIVYVDQQIAALVNELHRLGLAENTIIAITADHGEAFMEHDVVEHTECLYNEVLHIPLILIGPGLQPGSKVSAQVRSIDIGPTLLDLCGFRPKAEVQGVPLRPWIAGKETRPLLAVSETRRNGGMNAICDGRYKLISRQTSNQVELYDLHHDPEERTDLASTSDLLLRSMTERLRMWEEETRMCAERYWPEDVHDETVDVQPEVVERLRNLGYVE